MQVPESYKTSDEGDNDKFTLLKAPSYFADAFKKGDMTKEEKEKMLQDEFDDEDWKTRLQHWRELRTSQGAIKDFTEIRKELFESSNMSVLALLQTPITAEKISKRIETVFLNGCRRMAGLYLFSKILGSKLPDGAVGDICNWMCSGLREGTNKLTHYLNNIKGCGNHL